MLQNKWKILIEVNKDCVIFCKIQKEERSVVREEIGNDLAWSSTFEAQVVYRLEKVNSILIEVHERGGERVTIPDEAAKWIGHWAVSATWWISCTTRVWRTLCRTLYRSSIEGSLTKETFLYILVQCILLNLKFRMAENVYNALIYISIWKEFEINHHQIKVGKHRFIRKKF